MQSNNETRKYKVYGEIQSIDTYKAVVAISQSIDAIEDAEEFYYDGTLEAKLNEFYEQGTIVKAWITKDANRQETITKVEEYQSEEE